MSQLPSQHTLAEWEAQKENFVRLYITEDKSLNEVMWIMKTQFAFRTT